MRLCVLREIFWIRKSESAADVWKRDEYKALYTAGIETDTLGTGCIEQKQHVPYGRNAR